jgi:hypothetical protein
MSSDKLPRVLVSKSEQLNINSSDVKSMSIVHKQDAVMVTDEAFAVPICNKHTKNSKHVCYSSLNLH